MKNTKSLGISKYKGINIRDTRKEGRRNVRCIGFEEDESGGIYAHWQYIMAKTGKPSGKSTSFLVLLN